MPKEIKEKIIEDWEKEFKKRFTSTGLECDGDLAGYTSEAINFIRQLLSQEKQKWVKEILEMFPKDNPKDISPIKEIQGWDAGFSYALNKIKSWLKQLT